MGKKWSRKSTLLDYCLQAKQTVNRKHICTKRAVVAYLPQHLWLLMELLLWSFGHFGMKADIDEINEQLTIHTDYESDAYMKLIERVSDLSESSMPLKK
jgi:ATP-binding cassette subfamily F protein 3